MVGSGIGLMALLCLLSRSYASSLPFFPKQPLSLSSSSSSSSLPIPFPIPFPSSLLLPPALSSAELPVIDNLFLLLSYAPCSNCTYFLSIDTSLRLSSPLISQHNIHLIQYQVLPFILPLSILTTFPVAYRIPSLLPDSFVVVTAAQDNKMQTSQLSVNDQLVVGGDAYVAGNLVVHAIRGFLSPFAFAAPFPEGA